MAGILYTIADHNRQLVEEKKKQISLAEIKSAALAKGTENAFAFKKSLSKEEISFICEVKKASPSKGLIAPDFPYLEIAKEYEESGASAISCLTEPKWFQGSDEYLKAIAETVEIPVLRKDFFIDEYMIYEAKVLGASAILLICSLLDADRLRDWKLLANSLGMDALVEAHDEKEVETALQCGADIIGVNNRDLKTFEVDVRNSTRYRRMVPRDRIFVSESGISTRADIRVLEENGTDAVLIGETLMKSADRKKELAMLRGMIDA
ncbi:MAG: indole-3-glycerol phosphate synthase TrpC [Lachnospiraceae bacterium]|nr:indole-3-glycerol phosphate synthase TrpC [Lachnospiraceae bacterium]